MIRQFRRLYFHQIRFYVLNDPVTHAIGQKINNRGMNFRSGGKCPSFFATTVHDFRDLIGEFFVNSSPSLIFQLALRDRRLATVRTGAFGDGETSRLIRDFIEQPAMRLSDIERLD